MRAGFGVDYPADKVDPCQGIKTLFIPSAVVPKLLLSGPPLKIQGHCKTPKPPPTPLHYNI